MNKRAVIYARFSSHNQTEQSIEGQLRECYEYARRHDLTIEGEYIDRALTGTTDKRPSFLKMINDSKKKTFDYVLVYQLDRFARNRYDSANYKAKLKKNGVRVLSARENISDDASGILIEGVLESMAEYYSAELSQKVKRGFRESLTKGYFTGGRDLFGYDVVDKRWVLNPDEAAIVKEIFDRYKHGEKTHSIATRLNERGIRNKNGTEFGIDSITRILHNRKYTGKIEYNGEIYTNVTPAIVDEETFNECQRIVAMHQHRQKTLHSHSPYFLSGRLFCGKCGSNITSESGTNKEGRVYYYYKCTGRRKKICDQRNLQKKQIEDLVFDATAKYVLTPETINRLAVEVTKKFNAGLQNSVDIAVLQKQQKDVQRAINGFLSAIAEGIVTQSTKDKLFELEQENERLENCIAAEKDKSVAPISEQDVKAFLKYFAKKKYDSDDAMGEFFTSFIYRVVLFDDCVFIFYNTSPDMSNKFRLDKSELTDMKNFIRKRKSTLEPLVFKSGACGGERVLKFEHKLTHAPAHASIFTPWRLFALPSGELLSNPSIAASVSSLPMYDISLPLLTLKYITILSSYR